MNLQPTKINTFLLSILYSNSNLAIQVIFYKFLHVHAIANIILIQFQHMVQTGMTTPYTAFATQNGAGGPVHGPSPLKQAQQAALNDMKGPPSLVDNCHGPSTGNGGTAPPPPNGVTVASIQAAQVAAVQQAAAQAQAAAVAAAAQQQVAAAQAAVANGVESKGSY